jgi:hypothetical protein
MPVYHVSSGRMRPALSGRALVDGARAAMLQPGLKITSQSMRNLIKTDMPVITPQADE